MFDLSGKVALVTGGGGGIGRAVTLGLAEHGADVAVADLSMPDAEAAAHGVRAQGRRAIALAVDITQETEVIEMVDQVEHDLGPIDAFVNLVGKTKWIPALELSFENWSEMISVNLTGPFLTSRAVAAKMAPRGRGCIVNCASGTALRGTPGQVAYAAAKAGIVNMTKTLAVEWIRDGIRVNAVSPTMTETPLLSGYLDAHPGKREEAQDRIPAGRLGRPEDMVGPIVFLVSDAAGFMIGQTLWVDGGMFSAHPVVRAG